MFSKKIGSGITSSAVATVSPTATVSTPTDVTVTFPNGTNGIPKQIRASGSVAGSVILQYATGAQLAIPVNPNAPFTVAKIPPSAFPSPVDKVTLQYTASGAGTITIFIDY